MFVISVKNNVWYSVLAAIVLGVYGLFRAVSPLPEEKRYGVLLWFAIVIFVLYFVQRMFMFRDPEFIRDYGGNWKELLVQLLPCHLCYVSLILAIVGLVFRLQSLLAFCFYVGSFGAMMAVVSPDGYYADKSMLFPPVGLFYLLHGMLVALYCNLGFLALFPLCFKMGGLAALVLFLLGTAVHLLNLTGRAIGLSSINYIYTLHPSGSGLLEMLWNWIPVPYFYMAIPVGFVAGLWIIFVTLGHHALVFLGLLGG